MSWAAPTTTQFKAFFGRDFSFAPADDAVNTDYVCDADITKAIGEAQINFNSGLFGTDDNSTNVFMYLAAFHLVENLRNSAKGISAQAQMAINSSSVGGVSVNYVIPEDITKDSQLSVYLTNGYGKKYLTLVIPYLSGNINVYQGTTVP
jgi:Protein of unknown function (DUF4054)